MAIRSSTQSPYGKQSPAVNAPSDSLPTETESSRNRFRSTVRLAVGAASRLRARQLITIDVVGLVLASFLALAFRFDAEGALRRIGDFAPVLTVLLVIRVAANLRSGLYDRRWRYASVPELERIVVSVVAGSIIAGAIVYAVGGIQSVVMGGPSWIDGFPRSFWISELLTTLAVLGGVRFAIRAATEWEPRSRTASTSVRRTLLYGAGRTGVIMAASAQRHPDAGVLPVGFLDDDPALAGAHVGNLRVFGGLDALERSIVATGAEVLLITMPSADGPAIRRVVDAAMAQSVDVRTVPSINDLLDGRLDAHRVRMVQVEDLLRRPMATEHAAAVREIIQGRTIVITGAGGSIGSELARQVHALQPRRLVLVDRAESPLYLVQRALEAKAERGSGFGELRAHLVNVASRPAMDRLIALERPDVIFHAAAYKHVPMMEEHPSDAVHVNIGGTSALLEASIAAGVGRFVLVSTDKAVRPSSVMGASKRVAEMLVADAARRTGKPYVSVRFGNVLGSTGSVVPIFQEQLEKSEPLTITHPDMTRFFMTIPEASWLILDAAALGTSGDLFVLDMGEPVKIIDLARDLVRLAGRDPDTQPMRFVGLRPGEKLHEELFYDAEDVRPTEVSKILRAMAEPPPASVRDDVKSLIAMATGSDENALRIALMRYASRSGVPQPAASNVVECGADDAVDAGLPTLFPSYRDPRAPAVETPVLTN